MNFLALAMSKQCFLFCFKITSIMVEWISLIQNVAHLLYILNSYFLKEMYSKFTFYFLLELNLLLIPQSVFFLRLSDFYSLWVIVSMQSQIIMFAFCEAEFVQTCPFLTWLPSCTYQDEYLMCSTSGLN